MLFVVGPLDRAPAVGLPDRLAHGVGLLVGVHQDLAVDVAGGAADRLDQRRRAAEEALLVGVEDRDQRDLGQVQPLAQQVDADEHVVLAEAQLADDLDPLQRVDLRVQVAHAEAHLEQVVREVLGHLLGQRRHEHALVAIHPDPDLAHQVVDLVLGLADVDLRVHDPRRAHDLLDDRLRVRPLVVARRGRDEDHLRRDREELVEGLRPVVHRAGQPEPVVDERRLAREVARVHAADLRHGLVRLVDEADEVLREVVEQAVRARARHPAVQDARVVLDARAEPDFLEHLHVVLRALAQAVRLEQLALGLQGLAALVELVADLGHGALHRAFLDVVVRGRPDRDVLEIVPDELAGQRVEVLQALDLVAEQQRAERRLLIGREDLQRVPPHAERAAPERRVVAVVLQVHELAQQLVAVHEAALDDHLAVVVVGLRRAEAEDARDRRDDDHVPAREQRRRGRVAQAVDLLVDRRVLLDVEVPRRDVGLWLVVVVVGDEVLDRVRREVRPELVAQLRRQRLVVGDDQRRPLHRLDRRRHRHRLAGARGTEQRHPVVATFDARARRAIAFG